MRRIESTVMISSLLAAAACSGGVGTEAPNPLLGEMAGASSMLPTGAGGGAPTGAPTGGMITTPGGGAGAMMMPGAAGATSVPEPMAATECVPGVPATSQIPRITAFEYENIILDVFGVSNASLTLATDQAGVITQPTWDAYVNTAERVAVSVIGDPAARAKLVACDASLSEDECLVSVVENIGRKLFRRPLTEQEVAAYQTGIIAQRDLVTANGTLDEAAELILSTMLQSPSFLQRAEIAGTAGSDGTYTLSQHEVAARLSFMMWGSVPDDILAAAADAGELTTPEQIRMQADRMLQHENARRVVSTFHQEYLHLTSTGRWTATSKDTTLYPNFAPDAVGNMIYEELALFDHVFTSNGSFQDLLTTNKAWVTSYTAPLYGLTGQFSPTEYTEVDLDGSRPGFLTRIGFLAAFSNPERTNPIVRGAFITKEVLGIDPGDPNPDVTTLPLPADPSLVTIRDKVDGMTKAPGCAECHQPFINPPGFVLEGFDAAGVAQTVEAVSGGSVNTAANITVNEAVGPEPVANAAEMMPKIAASPSAQLHYAKKWVGYAYRRVLTGPDVCTAEALAQGMAAGAYPIRSLIADLTQQNYFTTRAVEVTQ